MKEEVAAIGRNPQTVKIGVTVPLRYRQHSIRTCCGNRIGHAISHR